MAEVYPDTDEVVALNPLVQDRLMSMARVGEIRAVARLNRVRARRRRRRGSSRGEPLEIEVSRSPTHKDVFVSLVGEGAVPAELGHLTPDGKFVPGLDILKGAFNLKTADGGDA